VKGALLREKARGGQAFFLHNRVESIDETAERLRGLCPQLRFIVAHGQMEDRQLESQMLVFLRGDADVLVSTSIIESGIDIPQANTLIIERADTFGWRSSTRSGDGSDALASVRTRICCTRRPRH